MNYFQSARIPVLLVTILLIILGAAWWIFVHNKTNTDAPRQPEATTPSSPTLTPSENSPTPAENSNTPLAEPNSQSLLAEKVPNAADAFVFSAEIPSSWRAEAIPEIEAINIYNPEAPGQNTLAQSQLFIRHFRANQFLTLSTVTIHERTELSINDRPAVRYDIEKRSGIANFPHQPTWRNERHIVTDIRVQDSSPSEFYVIAKRPELSEEVYQSFLESLVVVAPKTVGLVAPVQDFLDRITLKKFGQYITPSSSPVQPERFHGYHTGVDVEYTDTTTVVPVYAITDGRVILAKTATGYGGVVAISHVHDSQAITAVYGHLRPASLPAVGTNVSAGEQIGVLGEGGTAETDGERTHLHFAILRGEATDLRGYVATEAELARWLDPVTLYS